MAVFTEKAYTLKYLKDYDIERIKKCVYETGAEGHAEPRHIIYKINEQYHNSMETYRCSAVMTSSGQDMSYYAKCFVAAFENYKQQALRNIIPHWIRIISNCKKLLLASTIDMFEEFKRGHPHLSGYFDCKEFSWEIIGDSYHTNITTFIDCVITCILSKEAEDKQTEKIRKQQEIRKKQEEERKKQEEERKLLLYKKEFECAKLFDEIDKNKLQSYELYVEYKKITEIKDKDVLYNTEFINYFTEDKKKYIRGIIELVTNPKLVSNKERSTVASDDVEILYKLAAEQWDKARQPGQALYDPHLETATSVSPDRTISSSSYHNADSSVIFDSKNDENIVIRVSECNAENGVVSQQPAKKKRGRPSYKSLLLNL